MGSLSHCNTPPSYPVNRTMCKHALTYSSVLHYENSEFLKRHNQLFLNSNAAMAKSKTIWGKEKTSEKLLPKWEHTHIYFLNEKREDREGERDRQKQKQTQPPSLCWVHFKKWSQRRSGQAERGARHCLSRTGKVRVQALRPSSATSREAASDEPGTPRRGEGCKCVRGPTPGEFY